MLSWILFACEPATDPVVPKDAESWRPRQGAFPSAAGTTFAVWAPNAAALSVAGSWNDWTAGVDALDAGPGGWWSGRVTGAGAGDAYKFVIETPEGDELWRMDPAAQQATSSAGDALIVDHSAYTWEATDYRTPNWNDAVIYEMHIGTFADEPGGSPGTFASATDRLDDLQDLGINVVELLPPFEFSTDWSWGYNPALPYAPESAYGTPDDMKRFVDAAHARGIAVIADIVHNHWGPFDLPHWCFDGPCYDAGGIYFYTDDRAETPWGHTRPDFGRAEVRSYILDNARYWLETYRLDGLRWDSTVNIRRGEGMEIPDGWWLMQQANDAVDGEQPWKIMIAEDLQGNEWVTKPTGAGGAGFDAQWDGSFFHPVIAAVTAEWDDQRDLAAVEQALTVQFNGTPDQRVIYSENHDEVANGHVRIPQRIDAANPESRLAQKRSTLAAGVLLTTPGIPMLFQGQEVLEDGFFSDDDPVDWSRAETHAGIRQMYRDLIALRRNLTGTSRGLQGPHINVFHRNDAAKVMAYHRWWEGGPGDDVVIVANFSAESFDSYRVGLPRGGTWKVRFNGDWRGYSADFDDTAVLDMTARSEARDGLGFAGDIAVGPYSIVVLSQD